MSRTTIITVAREGEIMEDENHAKESSAISSHEILGNGDTEIFRTLIPLIVELDVLKTCRLVCKSWNLFACRSLRKLPWVFFPIREYNSDAINGLELLKKNKKLGLPSPFANFMVLADGFQNKFFLDFLKYVRDKSNNYSIDLRIKNECGLNPAKLQTVFTSNLHNFKITKLTLCGKFSGEPRSKTYREPTEIRLLHLIQPERIRLPHLNMLNIEDSALSNDSIVILCETLCHYSPLKFLQIGNNHEGEALKKVLSPGGMKSLENLVFTIENPISYEDWKYICSRIMEIPCLKNLSMYFPRMPRTDWWYVEGFETIIEHFAGSLESLKGAPLPTTQNKCLPKLREIHNSCLTSKYEFSYPLERYPLLKKATFLCGSELNEDSSRFPFVDERISGIEEFYFSSLVDFGNSGEVIKLIGAAGTVFPNVTTFSMTAIGKYNFTRAMLNAICKSVPKVTSLELLVPLEDDRTLSGLRERVVGCAEGGRCRSLENIPRESSLLDFPDLEKLSLGPKVVITGHLFKHCLSKIPKLQYLTFYLNGFVSAEDALESVGHLRRIRVVIVSKSFLCHEKRVEEIERLREMLPAAVEIQRSRDLPYVF